MPRLRDELTAAVLARSEQKGWKRIETPHTEFAWRSTDPEFLGAHAQVFVGFDSITVATERVKYLSWDEYPAGSGELAREYLRTVWSGTDAEVGAHPGHPGFAWQAPIVINPTPVPRFLSYVDIESCYWQLVSVYRPDDLPMGRFTEPGVLGWWRGAGVAATRRLRHSVVGCMFSNRLEFYAHGQPKSVPKTDRWSQPFIKRRVMSTLHAVVADLDARFHLWAWYTDGGIMEAVKAQAVVDHLARAWGITARVVATGWGEVYNATAYAVGDKRTRNIVNGRPVEKVAYSNLRATEEGVTWLMHERLRRVGE